MSRFKEIWKHKRVSIIIFLLIAGPVFSTGMVWASFASVPSRVEKLEIKSENQDNRLSRMEGKIDVIMGAFGLKYRGNDDAQ